MRRRAAWLLVMLVVVAALLVVLMVVFLHSSSSPQAGPPGPQLPTAPPTSPRHSTGSGSTSARDSASTGTSRTSSGVHEPPPVHDRHVSCPGDPPCVAQGDIGNAVAAINAYRKSHGVPPVDGAVTSAAQNCALTDGGTCTGSWAETEVPQPSGQQVVQKVQALTNLTDPATTSMQVGWAYNPSAHLYYFAIIQST